jgi:hypothetical protein
MLDTNDTTIRLGVKDDLPFVLSSWLHTVKSQYPNYYQLDFDTLFTQHMHSLLDKSILLVACLDSSPNDIISYLVYTSFPRFRGSDASHQQLVCHMAYTRHEERRMGQVNKLIAFALNGEQHPIVMTTACKNLNCMEALCKKYIYAPQTIGLL